MSFRLNPRKTVEGEGDLLINNWLSRAILAVAATRKQFVPIDGQSVIRDIMMMTMTSDHRMLSAATVARFLQEVKRFLQDPYRLLGEEAFWPLRWLSRKVS
jgi:pyruvate/2-oxoglutarate dehydrogenase complex dihydrolipoamide acyltransferase (E2) component